MKVDVTSMFFNSSIEGKTATAAWGTSIGQNASKSCRIETGKEGVVDFVVGMTYKSTTNFGSLDISKGSSNRELLMLSSFDKVYINGNKLEDAKYHVILVKELSESHYGRLIISYAPYITFEGHSNEETIELMRNVLGCSPEGCWFVYDISIKNQDELHFSAVVVNPEHPMIYQGTSRERSLEWNAMIGHEEETSEKHDDKQIIYYGAPGTGKSHKIKEKLAGVSKENIFRTTFHPDSDYSTFVGAYKPSTDNPKEKLYNKEELISKLTELKEQGVTYAPQKFGAQYWYSLKRLTLQDKKDILAACEMSDNYTVEFDKGIAVGEELLKKSKESRIIYKFIPQAFLNAYMRAYSTTDKVYLVIEEINRGNCAQIFGDLFQLLDRDENGVSEYCIKADADLRAYLEEELGADSDAIKDGELCLPSNLYIYATMNTSDQSLFPIDSAFKRRWDWEYEPIKYKNTNWIININGNKYSWVSFQREINKRIYDATSSEDKMLGDYFVNPSDGIVTEKILLNKILFYLWNDVCKDGEGDIFKTNETTDISFSELHGEGGSEKLVAMMKYLGVSLENNTIEENLDIAQLDQESKTWYLDLWTNIRKSLENNGQQNLPNARDRQTYQLSVGLTGISVLANISKTKANGFVCYYVEKQQANDIYPKLLNLKDTIENSLGELEWHREDNKYGIAKRNIELTSINDSSTRNKLIEQISKLLIDFKATIIPLVDQLR